MAPSLATTVTFTPVTGAIGAVVDGVDLHRSFDDATAQRLRDALHEHSVLFFHDQDLTED
jgi:alpha-ketoglutarate-dependent taurine dioxygenase